MLQALVEQRQPRLEGGLHRRDETEGERLVALQGLRAMAALLVVFGHAIYIFAEKAAAASGATVAQSMVDSGLAASLGDLGVRLFFVISGLVMVLSHAQDFGVPGAPLRFIARRIGRIVPLYWTMTLLYALKLAMEDRAPMWWQTLQSLLFIPQQIGAGTYGMPVYGLGWTLQYEMAFYAVFALALLLPLGRGVATVFGVFAAWMVLRATGVLGEANALAYFGDAIVLNFLIGMALGLARRGWLQDAVWSPGYLCATVLSAVVVIVAAATYTPTRSSGWVTVACMAAAASCAWAVEHPASNAAEAWLRRTAAALGDATYSIYLTHTLIIAVAARFVQAFWPEASVLVFAAVMVLVCAVVGRLFYLLAERSLVRYCRRLF